MTRPNCSARSTPGRLRLLLIASALALAPSCGSKGLTSASSTPPAADLTAEPEPQLDPRALTENRADLLDDYDIAHRGWGQRGWAAVKRLCWWFKDRGLATPECGPRP